MEINATLIVQMIAFIIYLFFCMYYIWPYVANVIEKRKKKLLSFAEELNILKLEISKINKDILKKKIYEKKISFHIIKKAKIKGKNILQKYKTKAYLEYNKIITEAKYRINIERELAFKNFYKNISKMILSILIKVTRNTFNENLDNKLINKVISKFDYVK